MEQILIASDFLMTKEKEQFSNLKWLRDLLSPPIKMSSNIEPNTFTSTLVDSEEKFSRIKFFELSGIDCDIHATQFYYNENCISDSSIEYLKQFITSNSLVVAYELSEQTRKILNLIGVNYIDIWLHPVRFMDDILFGFGSNNESVFSELVKYNVPEDQYRLYGNMFKISAYKGWKRSLDNLKVTPDSALFIGQTLEDKAVCRNGEMLNLLHFKPEFEAIGRKYGKVYYSRHPYLRKGDEEILNYLKKCDFAQVVSTPAYHLLASPNLSHVFSISSSVVFEAKYFGKSADFLYQPVIDLSDSFGLRSYISVFQEFVSPHFWSDILSPVLETKSSPVILFNDKKDKLRDMLAFYWNYKELDKVESTRMTLRAVDARVQRIDKKVFGVSPPSKKIIDKPAKPNYVDPQIFFREAASRIDQHEVISFDVFDTLLVRPFATPNSMFDLIEHEADIITSKPEFKFRKLRESARSLVKKPKLAEEVLLEERYHALTEEHGWGSDVAQKLIELEYSTEESVCYPREFGRSLFDYALSRGKKVFVTSDTFLSYEFVQKLLDKNNFKGYHCLITSSSEGLLKHSGNLFPVLIKKAGAPAAKILHIGDNLHSDIKRAKEHGLSTLHLERTFEAFTSQAMAAKNLSFADPLVDSVVKGIVANHLADNPRRISTPSHANGNAFDIGFSLLGPMFFGVAHWIRRVAIRDNVDTLFFLSRDGEILKKIYERIVSCIGGPEAHYVYASRRSVNVASIKTVEDAKALLDSNFTPALAETILKNRFGIILNQEERETLRSVDDAANADEKIYFKNPKSLDRLKRSVEALSGEILKNAKSERDALVAYYNKIGLQESDKRIAIVDIGHGGSIQASISKMLGIKSLGGYYFAAFSEMDKRFKNTENWYEAYLGKGIDEIKPEHPYKKNILMFELAFLNAENSFVRMNHGNDGQYIPEFLPEDLEIGRIDFAKNLHRGVLSFSEILCRQLGKYIEKIEIKPLDAIRGYSRMVSNPTLIDIEPFENISFENNYSCRNSSVIVTRGNKGETPKGFWIAAVEALHHVKEPELSRRMKMTSRVLESLVDRGIMSERKLQKFKKDSSLFFNDSKNLLVRAIGSLIGA